MSKGRRRTGGASRRTRSRKRPGAEQKISRQQSSIAERSIARRRRCPSIFSCAIFTFILSLFSRSSSSQVNAFAPSPWNTNSWWNSKTYASSKGMSAIDAATFAFSSKSQSSQSKSQKDFYNIASQSQQSSSSTHQQLSQSQSQSIERQIVTLGRKGQIDEALQVFHSVEPYPTVRQLNAIIDACGRSHPPRLSTALQLFYKYCDGDDITAVSASVSNASASAKEQHQQGKKKIAKVRPNVYTFGSLLSVCGRAGADIRKTFHLLDQMKTKYKIAPNAVIYNTIAAACARAIPPRPDLCQVVMEQAYAEGHGMTVVGYNAAVSAAARASQWKLAIQWLETMKKGEPMTSSSTKAKNEQQQQEEEENGVAYNPSKPAPPRNPLIPAPDAVTYGTILSACEYGRQWELLLEYAHEMQQDAGFPLDGLAVTSVLHACQQLGKAQLALEYLELMKQMKNIYDTDITTTTVVSEAGAGATSSRRHTAGWQVANQRQPLQGPDAVAYRLAISACARGGAWQDAIRVLNEYCNSDGTKTTGSSNNNNNNGGDVVAYTAAITGCEYAGEWKQAFGLLEQMRQNDVPPNEVTFAAVLGACATACAKQQQQNNNHDDKSNSFSSSSNDKKEINGMTLPQRKALQLLSVLRKDPTVPDPTIQVYNAAIRVCAEALDVKRAFQLFEALNDDGLQANLITYGTLMTACERVGNVQAASQVFRWMRDQHQKQQQEKERDGSSSPITLEPNEIIYGAAISCCRKAGGAERAMLLLQKMLKQNLKPNVVVFNTVLMAHAEEAAMSASSRSSAAATAATAMDQPVERAIEVYRMLNSKHYKAAKPNRQTYNILIRLMASSRRPREAEVFLRHMMERDGIVPDVDLYTATISAYERTGQPLKALRLMESMREYGYDFYESAILNAAFKRAVKLANDAIVIGKPGSAGAGGGKRQGSITAAAIGFATNDDISSIDSDEDIQRARKQMRLDSEDDDDDTLENEARSTGTKL